MCAVWDMLLALALRINGRRSSSPQSRASPHQLLSNHIVCMMGKSLYCTSWTDGANPPHINQRTHTHAWYALAVKSDDDRTSPRALHQSGRGFVSRGANECLYFVCMETWGAFASSNCVCVCAFDEYLVKTGRADKHAFNASSVQPPMLLSFKHIAPCMHQKKV